MSVPESHMTAFVYLRVLFFEIYLIFKVLKLKKVLKF